MARSSALADSLKQRRWQIIILLTMYLGYVGFMLCRNTLIASSVTMINDPNLQMDKESYGRLMSYHHAGAIAGKCVTGIAADVIGGRRMFLAMLGLTAAATAAFGAVSSNLLFGVFNFFGQFFKAGGWPSMAKIIGNWYPKDKYGTVWSIISTSSRVGTMLAGFAVFQLLQYTNWRSAFYMFAGVTALIVIVGYFLLKERPSDIGVSIDLNEEPERNVGTTEELETVNQAPHPMDTLSIGQACLAFAKSGRVWFISLSIALLTILMDFIIFIPLYLDEAVGLDSKQAPLGLIAFAGGMFCALIATSLFYDRLNKKQLIAALGGLLTLSCCSVVALWSLGSIGLPEESKFPVVMIVIFVFGFSISPAYYVPMSVFSVAYGGKHSGLLINNIDICGYAAAMIFTYFGGSIAMSVGWNVLLSILLGFTVLALVTMTSFLVLDYRALITPRRLHQVE